ncbi:hypothetical protein HK103_007037 [Boothiomyces macroporosus]|uniref:Uncharacterized protein n=1 Tax=Boothiomyces macroporosus TaxID=261099 RepID=A0AAD5UCL9_9FUNG|nr:hypothetical protein HK103_007037 [Boothiomyces macroporosus]
MEHFEDMDDSKTTITDWAKDTEQRILNIPLPPTEVAFGDPPQAKTVKKVDFAPSPLKREISEKRYSQKELYSSFESDLEEQEERKRGIKEWYVGHKSDGKKRFCGNRLNLCQFTCIHICVLIIVLLIILIPIIYFVIIPHSLEKSISNNSLDGTSLKVALVGLSSLNISTGLPAYTFLPGTANLVGPTTFAISEKTASSPFVTVVVPDLFIPINQYSTLNTTGNLTLLSLPNIFTMLNAVNGQGTDVIVMSTKWTIKLWGITWYRDLPLSSSIDLNSPSGKKIFNSITSGIKIP